MTNDKIMSLLSDRAMMTIDEFNSNNIKNINKEILFIKAHDSSSCTVLLKII